MTMRFCVSLVALIAASLQPAMLAQSPGVSRPNVVLVITDNRHQDVAQALRALLADWERNVDAEATMHKPR
jgi:hypothetical protein